MNKVERMRAALAGKPVDRPPSPSGTISETSTPPPSGPPEVHLEFYDYYDLDFLKVMNDYDYPMPAGMETMESPEDSETSPAFRHRATPLGQPAASPRIYCQRPPGKGPVCGHPLQCLEHGEAEPRQGSHAEADGRPSPDALLDALEIVNQNLIRYALASLERGSAGHLLLRPRLRRIRHPGAV